MAAEQVHQTDDEHLASLGYEPQLNRVLGLFSNFSVAFTYLSPMVGIYSLFALGVAAGGPAYLWLLIVPVIGMLLVALVFGELASHYPIAGALYQYSKFSVGPRYGWMVGWLYGIALLVTVASVDSGIVSYFTAFTHNLFDWNLNPESHGTVLLVTLVLLVIQTLVNVVGAKAMALIARFGVYVELMGTFGIAIILLIHGFHHGLGYLFTTQGVQHVQHNPAGLNFHGHWWTGAALVAVLAPVYIIYGFESAGDISEETVDAGRHVPRSMRLAVVWGGIASFVLTLALLLAIPNTHHALGNVYSGGVAYIFASLPTAVQDILLLLVMFAFFSCGSSVQGAGSRLMFSYARDRSLPAASWISQVNQRFKTPVNALITGAVISALFMLLVFPSPTKAIHILFITYPPNVNGLTALVSFGVSGIYLSFLLTVIAAIVARRRGWVPAGKFQLGKWGWTVSILAAVYLGLMLINVVFPSGIDSGRAVFNIDWITLVVMFIIVVIGGLYLLFGHPSSRMAQRTSGQATD
jgi:amino acid transporter